MKVKRLVSSSFLSFLFLACATVEADTADVCIDQYESMKAQFETASTAGLYECIRVATALNLFATGVPPAECDGEDEWHLVAKSVVGNPGACIVRIMGTEGLGCSAEMIEHELTPPEAAGWQKHLLKECKALGTIRGSGKQGG
jgi:hypothetical protein